MLMYLHPDLPAISIALRCFIHYSYPSSLFLFDWEILLLFEYIEYIEYTQNNKNYKTIRSMFWCTQLESCIEFCSLNRCCLHDRVYVSWFVLLSALPHCYSCSQVWSYPSGLRIVAIFLRVYNAERGAIWIWWWKCDWERRQSALIWEKRADWSWVSKRELLGVENQGSLRKL